MNKRGMEMAIQVFIILFVLLAVAMLVLQMVSTQFSEQQRKLEEQRRKQALESKLADMRGTCNTLCTQANSEGTLKAKARFCIKAFRDGVDLTLNGATNDYDESFLVGTGICEDAIYCPQLVDCDVGTKLDMTACKAILCSLWKSQGFTDEQISEKLKQFVQPGSCYSDPINKPNHWYTRLFDADGDGTVDPATEVRCP
ncbi:MAG: hypothetical protein J7L44_02895 [Candidatus Diapherotrites archaeon]|nr:hypothetical protein [Candidatus Diapherotrites archaeon]